MGFSWAMLVSGRVNASFSHTGMLKWGRSTAHPPVDFEPDFRDFFWPSRGVKEVILKKKARGDFLLGDGHSSTPYKWPYKWVTGVITLLIGVINLVIHGRGPTL